MEATELLDQAYGKWKVVAKYCRGYFNLAIDKIRDDDYLKYKLDGGTLTELEKISPELWFKKKYTRAFVRSVKTLVKFRFDIIQLLPAVQSQIGAMQYPKWRYWGRENDGSEKGVLLGIQEVGLITDMQLWSYGHPLFVTNDDGTQRDPLRIAGDILGSLRGDTFKEYPDDCRNHLLQNEEWVEEFFETTRLRTESIRGGKPKKESGDYPANGEGGDPKQQKWGIVLQGEGEPLIVNGIEKDPLSKKRYDLLKALAEAKKGRLHKDQLIEKSGCSGALGMWSKISGIDNDWKKVIYFPENRKDGYRIIDGITLQIKVPS